MLALPTLNEGDTGSWEKRGNKIEGARQIFKHLFIYLLQGIHMTVTAQLLLE